MEARSPVTGAVGIAKTFCVMLFQTVLTKTEGIAEMSYV